MMDDAEDKVTQMSGKKGVGDPGAAKLRDAMRKARVAQTVRNDVIVDLRETELARLEVLADALEPIFAEVPQDAEQFECALVPGSTPRLWIDMLAFVDMGRDKRTYRFVSDTRAGRQVMLETTNVASLTDRITDYIAHRLVERERSLTALPPQARQQSVAEADLGEKALAIDEATSSGERSHVPQTRPAARRRRSTRWREGTQIGIAYVAGMLMGASAVILLALYLTA